MRRVTISRSRWLLNRSLFQVFVLVALLGVVVTAPRGADATTTSIPDSSFEAGSFGLWGRGAQTGTLGASIGSNGTGVTVFTGTRTFTGGTSAAAGQPTVGGNPNPFYAPAVTVAATWTFGPNGSYAVALQPRGQATFDAATSAVGLTSSENQSIKTTLTSQKNLAGYGGDNPTDAAWITQSVTLSAGVTYSMAWNYVGTDYAPFNDGSITSLTTTSATAASVVTVNNSVGRYALLGFTNPGTGDYSTGSFGSTGWQIATYQVTVTGEYLIGFVVFNLDDTSLDPVLMIDDAPGTTLKDGQPFGAVASNNPNAPQIGTTTTTSTTTTVIPVVAFPPCCGDLPQVPVSTPAPLTSTPSSSEVPTSVPVQTARPTVPGNSVPAVPVTQVAGSLPNVPVGQSVVTQNGQLIPVTVEQTSPGSWQLTGNGFQMSLAVPLPGGGLAQAGDGEVVLVQNRTVDVAGNGFRPGTLVDVWLFSTPRFLGTVLVNPDGTFDGTLNLPPDVPVGSHTLQANGITTDSQVRSLNLGVRVLSSNPRLPVTGDSLGRELRLAALVSSLGLLSRSLSRLRRRRLSA